ncbi:hypothetical protein [Embleya scabrispora]|uniref:hypothetical protein n=1 Tax=Embleya scabrispora TaxID=159449 RepID=UPI00039FC399|nr:hypothetical protein [Embleya scabrispora]
MDPLLDAAVCALGVTDEPCPLTAHHDTAWRAGSWKIKTVTGSDARALPLHEVRAVRLLHAQGLHPADGRYRPVPVRPRRPVDHSGVPCGRRPVAMVRPGPPARTRTSRRVCSISRTGRSRRWSACTPPGGATATSNRGTS